MQICSSLQESSLIGMTKITIDSLREIDSHSRCYKNHYENRFFDFALNLQPLVLTLPLSLIT